MTFDASVSRVRGWLLFAYLIACALSAVANPAQVGDDTLMVVVDGTERGLELVQTISQDYPVTVRAHWPLASLDIYCLELLVDSEHASATVISTLRRDHRVDGVQQNQFHRVAAMPVKDPYFDLQSRTRRGGIDSILRQGSGRNVRIAVIDTGVDVAHPDLQGQISTALNFVGSNAESVPGEFHGTAVVGLISAVPGNGIGIHGIAPDAEILALRACWEPAYGYGLCSTNTLAQALDYAIDVRAKIINLSLAGPEDPLLNRLVERAIELGAVVFGAVGVDDKQPFPSSIDGVIAVQQGLAIKTTTSSVLLRIPGQQLLSTVPDGRYDFVTGSSFATAHASGVAAVMLDRQPHLRSAELVEWLQRLHGNQSPP